MDFNLRVGSIFLRTNVKSVEHECKMRNFGSKDNINIKYGGKLLSDPDLLSRLWNVCFPTPLKLSFRMATKPTTSFWPQ